MARHGVAGIFGEILVDVQMDISSCTWIVRSTDGHILLQVPWRWAYDQKELGKRSFLRSKFLTEDEFIIHTSRWEAFEMCMCAYPLTSEHKALLNLKFPGIASQRQYVFVNSPWSPVTPEQEQQQAPASNTEQRQSFASSREQQSTDQAVTEQEQSLTHEVGERKLLL